MLIKSAYQFLTIALLMTNQELALPASRDMTSRKENASSLISTTPTPLIQDAVNGIGTTKSASLALTNGFSMLIKSVCQFLTNALLTMLQVPASLASRDMILKTENASSPTPTMPSLLILDAVNGIGTTKSASPALTNGFSTLTRFACQFLTNVPPTMPQELVLHASRDMTSRKENASSLISTTPTPLIQDAVNGIGTTKSASLALTNGFSMIIRSACQFLTNALLTMPLEPVLPASRDMTSRTENASSLNQTTPSLLILDVVSGIGATKSA